MGRGVLRLLALILALGITSTATAHHPPLMERCASFSFSGQVERIEWHRPHVELFIRTDDERSYRVIWLGAQLSPGLEAAHTATATALAGTGIREDLRAFHPHVTLARVKRGARPIGESGSPSTATRPSFPWNPCAWCGPR